jgi:hypothetical protein
MTSREGQDRSTRTARRLVIGAGAVGALVGAVAIGWPTQDESTSGNQASGTNSTVGNQGTPGSTDGQSEGGGGFGNGTRGQPPLATQGQAVPNQGEPHGSTGGS